MKRRVSRLGLPLLARELNEQAGRRRTYVLRLLYGTLLFLLAFWQFERTLAGVGPNIFSALGTGAQMFRQVMLIQFLGILLFLPALVCGAITSEKERDSLSLLLITRLSPWTILVEKLLGRLVPMFSFLLLSLPLLAFAYSLGGVSTMEMISGVCILCLTCLHVGTLSLMCSSWATTTVSAFIGTYALGLVTWFGLGFLGIVIHSSRQLSSLLGIQDTLFTLMTSQPGVLETQAVLLLVPALLFFGLSRIFLVRRAQVTPKNLVLEFFRRLDTFFTWLNDITTGGVLLVRDDVALPEDEPITWRETRKKSLGTTRYLVRVLVTIETPLFLVLAAVAGMALQARLGIAAEALYVIWSVSVLLISVQATSLISSERTHQTLDVLLATPLTSREIVLQKFRGPRRLIRVLWIPFLTVFLFEVWFAHGTEGLSDGTLALLTVPFNTLDAAIVHYDYMLCAILSIIVYLPLTTWLAFLVGTCIRSQARSLLVTLLLIFGWAFLPVLLTGTNADRVTLYLMSRPPVALASLLVSPSVIIMMNETRGLTPELGRSTMLLCTIVNFAFYGLIWWQLRAWCLTRSDRLMGRLSSQHTFESARPSESVTQPAAG